MLIGGAIARIGSTWPTRSSVLPEIELSWHRLRQVRWASGSLTHGDPAVDRTILPGPLPQFYIGGIVSNFGTAGSTRSQATPRTV